MKGWIIYRKQRRGRRKPYTDIAIVVGTHYCVGALAHSLHISEAAVSQHLKVLREAGLIKGMRHGYFMYYDVNSEALDKLGNSIQALTSTTRKPCELEPIGCHQDRRAECQCRRCGPSDAKTQCQEHKNGHCGMHGKEEK